VCRGELMAGPFDTSCLGLARAGTFCDHDLRSSANLEFEVVRGVHEPEARRRAGRPTWQTCR